MQDGDPEGCKEDLSLTLEFLSFKKSVFDATLFCENSFSFKIMS